MFSFAKLRQFVNLSKKSKPRRGTKKGLASFLLGKGLILITTWLWFKHIHTQYHTMAEDEFQVTKVNQCNTQIRQQILVSFSFSFEVT